MKKVLIAFLCFVTSSAIARVPFSVARFITCENVSENLTPINPFTGTFNVKPGPGLFCFFELLGNAETAKELDRRNSMPIKLIWRIGIRNVEKIDIGITAPEWRNKRSGVWSEIEEKGYFTWRTYCVKKYFEADSYTLHLVNGSGDRMKSLSTNNAFEQAIAIHGL